MKKELSERYMNLNIYNTLTRQKEPFQSIEPGKILMYVCGPTVYDSCHIGHARSVVVFVVIVRYFKSIGYNVTYVRNFTDVDDKIIKRANELGTTPQSLSEGYIDEFHRDMDALHVQRATFEPRVTEHMDEIIAFIETLLKKHDFTSVIVSFNGKVPNNFEGAKHFCQTHHLPLKRFSISLGDVELEP